MKLNLAISLTIFTLAVLLVSCDDDEDVLESGTETTYSGMSDFYARNGVAFQTFQINSVTGDTITGSNGTVIRIQPNSFFNANNQPVSGMITLKLKEIYNKTDMLLSGMTTTSWEQVLYSAGMFKLESYLNDDTVYFSNNTPYFALLPSATNDPAMNLYVGISTGGTLLNWISADSLGGYVQYNSTQAPHGYFLEYFSSNWINCDALSAYPNITINVTTQNNPNPDSTNTFVWFSDINGIRDLDHISSNLFGSMYMKPVPATLISFTVSGGKIYAGLLNVSAPSNGSTYIIPMQHMTDEAFKDSLATLN